MYPQFKTIPEQWDKHVKEYFPPCVQEVARNKDIKSSNMLTHHGDLEPFDLQSIDPSTSSKKSLKLIQREKAMLPPKHDSFDYLVKRDFYAIVCKKVSSTMPEVDVFGGSGDPNAQKVVTDPYCSEWSAYYCFINTKYEDMHRVIDKIVHEKVRAILIVPAWHHRHWFPTLTRITTAAYRLLLQALQMRNGASSPLPHVFPHLACLVDGSLMHVARLDGEPKDTLNKDTTAQLCNIVNDITGCSLFGSNKACAATTVAQLRHKIPKSCAIRHMCDVTHYTPPVVHHSLDRDDLTDIEYSSSEGDNTSDWGSNSSSNNTCLSDFSDQALPQVSVKKLSKSAVLPTRGTIGSAGMDLCAATSINIPAGGQVLVPIDLAFALPDGLDMQLASRSGLAAHHRVQVIGGVIDKVYRGNVKIILANWGSSDFPVKCGDRIAQMLVFPTPDFSLVEVDTLPSTQRSTLGFGNTGVASAKATINNVTGEHPGCEQITTINVGSIGGPTDDITPYISSDICFTRGNRCRCHVGRNAWSVFKRLRSNEIQPEDTCLPF